MKLSHCIDKIKEIKSWRSLVILGLGFLLGLLLDAFVEVTGVALVYVSADYPNEAFAAACSVAVLGNAILSLLFGASDKIIRGIPFQDILHSSKFGSDQQLTIVATTWSVIFAIYAYSKGLCTTLTFLVCLDAFLILSSSIDLWKILSDNSMQMKVVNEIIADDGVARYDVYVDSWFHELNQSLDFNNEGTISEFCDLISSINAATSDGEHPINSAIARHIPILFESACEKIGFVDAYKLIKRINNIRPDGFIDCESTALDYIKSLKYCNTINTHNRSIPTIVEAIIEKLDTEDWEKTSFVYRYFCAVFDNAYINADAKNDLLLELLDVLTYLRDDNGAEVKKEVLLLVIKHDVILNNNKANRTILFKLMTEALLRNNRYADDQVFVGTIAEIFRAFFFYIYREVETLTKEYRDGLLELYRAEQNKKDMFSLSFTHLITENYEKVIFWLAKDAATFDRRRRLFWDYFSPVTGFKSIVWSSPEVIRFAFCFYKLIGYTHDSHPFAQIIDADKYEDHEKMAICREIINLYDDGELNSAAMDIIHQLEELTGIHGPRSNFDNLEHDYFQDRLSEFAAKKSCDVLNQGSLTDDTMLQMVNEELEQGNVFELDAGLQLRPTTRRRIEPSLVEMNVYQAKHSAYRIAQIIKMIMNGVIERKLRKVHVDFSEQGIQTLVENLKDGDWQYRNYIHINDYAIMPAVRESDTFMKLSGIINGIHYDNSHEIRSYVFLKAPKVPYNINLHYHLEEPNEEKCAEFVKRHQLAEGVYQIGSNRFDYSHAIKYVRQNYKLEIVDFSVRVGINDRSGFSVRFDKR